MVMNRGDKRRVMKGGDEQYGDEKRGDEQWR